MLLAIWGESGSVLDKTQTFIGVLATLIVLCLIRDRTNFIFRLVQTIHLEADISRRTSELNKSIKDGDSLTGMIERITKKKIKIQDLPADIHDKLLNEWQVVDIQPNIFNSYAEERNKAYKEKYAEIKDRKEGLFNARFSFAILLVVMLIDCWPISDELSALILLYLLIFYVLFTSVLWVKYTVGKSSRPHVYFTKTRGLVAAFLMMLVSFLLSLWGISYQIMSPSFVKLEFALTFIITFALMVHYKVFGIENTDKYNNGWLAKHAAYIATSSILLAVISLYIPTWLDDSLRGDFPFNHLSENVAQLSADLGLMRTVFVTYVAVNTFFVETLLCYLFNIWHKFANMGLIKNKFEECKRNKKIHMQRCKKIICSIKDDDLFGERTLPNKVFFKSITIGRHNFTIDLRHYDWGR